MKKNISINISGIIFHIEEDGYKKLKKYLESINKYFSSFDDSGEIIADIESRIAEIFLSKLNEGKQVITAEDVESLVATMGSIKDFQAIEEPETVGTTEEQPGSEEKKEEQKSEKKAHAQPKKLYRDNKRKLLGGVCSGIAHYLTIDPLWVRLLFIILAADIFFSHSLGVLVLIAYIILWIILPISEFLEEDTKIKKMYRNPEDRVLGGVASGIAAYFGADVTVIRLLFVLSIFVGGAGLIAYLILWIILPEARSITDKVQMTGEPVTLENIESNIKKSLKVEEGEAEEESTITKIVLFPFRLLAMIIKGLGKLLGPLLQFLIEAARIILGLILVLTGISFIFALIVSMGVVLGLVTGGGGYMSWWDFPYEIISEAFPTWAVIMAFVASFIPALVITLLGLSIIAKTKVVNATVGWTMFAFWLISLVTLSFTVPKIIYDFRAEGDYEQTEVFSIQAQSIHLELAETGMDDYESTHLDIKGYDGEDIRLVKEFRAFGSSRRDAIENAQMITYNVVVEDSILLFDSNVEFKPDAKFRFQELDMTLYVPYGQEFTISDDMRHILKYYTISRHGYYYYQMEDNRWVYNPSGLECITCFDSEEKVLERSEDIKKSYEESFRVKGYYEELDFTDFSNVVITGVSETNIIRGDEFRVVVNGSKEDVAEVVLSQDGDELIIKLDRELLETGSNRNRTKITIGMPELSKLEMNGASKAWVRGFDEDRVSLELNGASEADVDIDSYEVNVDLSGASKLTISGTGHELEANLSAASSLDAYEYRVNDARIDASVASSAKVYVRENLEINASMASDIKYRGGAKVRRNR
jgi:phage shock protein PspC (stress-responsive transcriptional regulator)